MPFLLNLQYDCRETVQLAVGDGTDAILAMPLASYSEETVTDRRVLSRQLAEIRQPGHAESHQEYHWGSTSVAVPVLVDDTVKAAIGIDSK